MKSRPLRWPSAAFAFVVVAACHRSCDSTDTSSATAEAGAQQPDKEFELLRGDAAELRKLLESIQPQKRPEGEVVTLTVDEERERERERLAELLRLLEEAEASGDPDKLRDFIDGQARALGDSYLSFPPFHLSVHDRITKFGLGRAGFTGEVIDDLMEAVRHVDRRESENVPFTFTWRPNAKYVSAHHFDRWRFPDGSIERSVHRKVFSAGCGEIAAAFERFIVAFNAVDRTKCVIELGNALHAAQDFYSHSNWVDLRSDEQSLLTDMITRSRPLDVARIPSVLKTTAYFAGAEEPGDPDDDPFGYVHDLMSKDNAGKNDEAEIKIADETKFELHFRGAVVATQQLAHQLEARVANPERWRQFVTSQVFR